MSFVIQLNQTYLILLSLIYLFFPITPLLSPFFIFPHYCFFIQLFVMFIKTSFNFYLKKVDQKNQTKTCHLLNLDDSMLLTRCSFLDVWMILKTSLPGSLVGTWFRWFLSFPHWQVCGIVLAGCSPGPCISNLMMYSSSTAILFSNNRRSTFVTKHFDVKIQHWKSVFFFFINPSALLMSVFVTDDITFQHMCKLSSVQSK